MLAARAMRMVTVMIRGVKGLDTVSRPLQGRDEGEGNSEAPS